MKSSIKIIRNNENMLESDTFFTVKNSENIYSLNISEEFDYGSKKTHFKFIKDKDILSISRLIKDKLYYFEIYCYFDYRMSHIQRFQDISNEIFISLSTIKDNLGEDGELNMTFNNKGYKLTVTPCDGSNLKKIYKFFTNLEERYYSDLITELQDDE